jgi:hypothetical protein
VCAQQAHFSFHPLETIYITKDTKPREVEGSEHQVRHMMSFILPVELVGGNVTGQCDRKDIHVHLFHQGGEA